MLATTDGWQFRTWWAVLERNGSAGPLDRLDAGNLRSREPLLMRKVKPLTPEEMEMGYKTTRTARYASIQEGGKITGQRIEIIGLNRVWG
jgi:hypothetical protein